MKIFLTNKISSESDQKIIKKDEVLSTLHSFSEKENIEKKLQFHLN